MKRWKILVTGAWLITLVGCAATRYRSVVDHAVTMCKQINGPDAEKGEGEVQFWFQSERASASRQLWNHQGLAAIEAKRASASSRADLACLGQLQEEAATRQLSED
ncbi:MAG: hypothetical protein ABIP56_05795 [Dokdonella sp.]